MSLEQAMEFARKVGSDAELGGRVAAALRKTAGAAAAAAFSAVGREEGFDFTPEDAAEARARGFGIPMADGELDNIAGGIDSTLSGNTAQGSGDPFDALPFNPWPELFQRFP